jgi:hypothetical protein
MEDEKQRRRNEVCLIPHLVRVEVQEPRGRQIGRPVGIDLPLPLIAALSGPRLAPFSAVDGR